MLWFIISNIWAGLVFIKYCLLSALRKWLFLQYIQWSSLAVGDAQMVEEVRWHQSSLSITWEHYCFYLFQIVNFALFFLHYLSFYKAINLWKAKKRRALRYYRSKKMQDHSAISVQKDAAIVGGSHHMSQKLEACLQSCSCSFVLIHWLMRAPWKQWPLLLDTGLDKVLLEDCLSFLLSDFWPFRLQRNCSYVKGVAYIPKEAGWES